MSMPWCGRLIDIGNEASAQAPRSRVGDERSAFNDCSAGALSRDDTAVRYGALMAPLTDPQLLGVTVLLLPCATSPAKLQIGGCIGPFARPESIHAVEPEIEPNRMKDCACAACG